MRSGVLPYFGRRENSTHFVVRSRIRSGRLPDVSGVVVTVFVVEVEQGVHSVEEPVVVLGASRGRSMYSTCSGVVMYSVQRLACTPMMWNACSGVSVSGMGS